MKICKTYDVSTWLNLRCNMSIPDVTKSHTTLLQALVSHERVGDFTLFSYPISE